MINRQESDSLKNVLVRNAVGLGLFSLNIWSSFQTNILAKEADSIYHNPGNTDPTVKADAAILKNDAYHTSRAIGFSTIGLFAVPVSIEFWKSLKNLKDLSIRAQSMCVNREFFAGLLLDIGAFSLFASSFYASGSENPQDSLAFALSAEVALYAGSFLVNRHGQKIEAQEHQHQNQQDLEGAPGYVPIGSPPAPPALRR